jgi:hypothetical protein
MGLEEIRRRGQCVRCNVEIPADVTRICSRHERCDGGFADAPRLCFTGELLLPSLEASRCAAALRSAV